MLFGHDWPIAAPMCDGRVYVDAGGSASNHNAEIYDPVTDSWVPTAKTKGGHTYGAATLMADCRILLSGGYDSNTFSEVYDPSTGIYKLTGQMGAERFFHTLTVLPDGRVLAVGGGVPINGKWSTKNAVDLLDPTTLKWTKADPLHYRRRAHTATLLPDGRVLVAGGTDGGQANGTEGGTQLSTSEIYDPATDTWQDLPPLHTARALHTAALLPSGGVILLGGLDGTGSASPEVEVFLNGTWTPLSPLLVDRFHHASATLADARILVTGGVHQATAEIYVLGQPGDPCESDAACAGGVCSGGVCCSEPCEGGCRRCDFPGREGECVLPCAAPAESLACADGSSTCPIEACLPVPCAPYLCSPDTGACRTECLSVEDCAPGYACDLEGRCTPPPDVSSVPSGCTLIPPSSPPRAPHLLCALLAALAFLRLRRRDD
ncbi:MAG: kelch repeat-containing protein [Polyangiaceae bacterium]